MLVLGGVLAVIWSEGIAAAEQVNPAEETVFQEPLSNASEADRPERAVRPAEFIVAGVGILALWVFFVTGWHRIDRAPTKTNPMTPMMGFILVALLFLAAIIGATTMRSLFGLGDDLAQEANPVRAHAVRAAGAHTAQLLVLLLPLWVWFLGRRRRNDLRPSQRHAVILGIGGLAVFWPIVMLVSFLSSVLVLFMTGKPVDPVAHGTLALFRDQAFDGWMLLLIVLVVLAAPIVEEVMYRGLVQESIGQLGLSRWTAIMLTSLFFALMHLPVVEPHALLMLFTLSIGFGWIYEKTGRLAAPIAMHAAFNVGNLALVMLLGAD